MADLGAMMPYEIDFFDDNVNFRTHFRIFYERINALGKYTTQKIARCVEEDESSPEDSLNTYLSDPREQREIRHLFETWRNHYIVYLEDMQEIRHVTTAELDPETLKRRKLKDSHGLHVFMEITRLFALLNYPRILLGLEDEVALENMEHPLWVSIASSFDISAQYEAKEERDEEVEERYARLRVMWSKPILSYTLVETIHLILFLTQQLNDINLTSLAEFTHVFEVVWIRAAHLAQEYHPADVLDDPEMCKLIMPDEVPPLYVCNRDFHMFCSFYLGEVMRRLFYTEMLSKRAMALPELVPAKRQLYAETTKKWAATIIEGFADEAFSDLYGETCNDAYSFVGDDRWFKYKWANRVHSRGACLLEMRPHLYRRFHSEGYASKRSIIESINTSHVSRLFFLKAVSTYIQIKSGNSNIKWFSGVVVASDGIKMSAYNLSSNMSPQLLQVLSTFYAYDQTQVYITDNIYESIAIWFYLLTTRYKNQLYGHSLLQFSKAVLSGPAAAAESINPQQQNRGAPLLL